jgi:hypothetical protein
MRLVSLISLFTLALIICSADLKTKYGKIKIDIDGLPKTGALAVAIFKSADGFPHNFNKAAQCKYFSNLTPKDSLYFNAPYGKYAITVKWDEFYIRPDTISMVYNHMQGLATSEKNEGKFESSKFVLNKKELNIALTLFKIY